MLKSGIKYKIVQNSNPSHVTGLNYTEVYM
jgi:hypothetical protein